MESSRCKDTLVLVTPSILNLTRLWSFGCRPRRSNYSMLLLNHLPWISNLEQSRYDIVLTLQSSSSYPFGRVYTLATSSFQFNHMRKIHPTKSTYAPHQLPNPWRH